MRQLLHGVRIFQHRVFPACRSQFEQLAKGQAPSTLFITCSDSRIVPELVTQTAPGELFVLRNAGNLVPAYSESEPSGEAATIEFAIEVLKVRDVIICGHSHCGAIKGLLQSGNAGGSAVGARMAEARGANPRSDFAPARDERGRRSPFDGCHRGERAAAARASADVSVRWSRRKPAAI